MWLDEERGTVANGGLLVQFYTDTKLMVFKSQQAGYPIYEAIDRVKVWQDKDNNNIFDVDESHKRRWPDLYRQFKEGKEQIMSGTPLDALFPANPEIISTLKANMIQTVEQLAAITDASQFKFALPLQQKAALFLKHRESDAMPQMEHKMAEMEETIAALQAQLAEQPRRGPGRPPKIHEMEHQA
jgi:hypothetical protein